MTYTPTEWKAGDTVTVSKLNKIEQGIVNAGSSSGSIGNNDIIIPVFTKNGTTYTCNMTFAEIAAEVSNGKKLAGCVVAEVLNGQVSLEYFMGTISYLKDAFAQFSSTSINGVNGSFTATLSYEDDNKITFERKTITIPSGGALILTVTQTEDNDSYYQTLSETFETIYNAINEGKIVYTKVISGAVTRFGILGGIEKDDETPQYIVIFTEQGFERYYYANTFTDYPVYAEIKTNPIQPVT